MTEKPIAESFTYPEVSVTCEPGSRRYKTVPRVLLSQKLPHGRQDVWLTHQQATDLIHTLARLPIGKPKK